MLEWGFGNGALEMGLWRTANGGRGPGYACWSGWTLRGELGGHLRMMACGNLGQVEQLHVHLGQQRVVVRGHWDDWRGGVRACARSVGLSASQDDDDDDDDENENEDEDEDEKSVASIILLLSILVRLPWTCAGS